MIVLGWISDQRYMISTDDKEEVEKFIDEMDRVEYRGTK